MHVRVQDEAGIRTSTQLTEYLRNASRRHGHRTLDETLRIVDGCSAE
jgi:hypothetical protein